MPGVNASAAEPRLGGLYVVVLTLNEAHQLGKCLQSASFAEKMIVIDSGSRDDTVTVAHAHGAQVHAYNDWQGFAVQRNRSLAHCVDARYVLFLDADEIILPALQVELRRLVQSGARGAWRVRWRYVAFGTVLSRMKSTRGMLRFFDRESLKGFEGAVHETAVLEAGTLQHQLKQTLLHHSYSSVESGLRKLVQYTALGAAKRAAQGQRGGVFRGLVSASAAFFRLYVLKGGCLHGGPGFLYCYFLAQECFFRQAALHYDRDRLSTTARRD